MEKGREAATIGASLASQRKGLFYLTEDLGLAHNHGVQAGSHGQQVLGSLLPGFQIEVRLCACGCGSLGITQQRTTERQAVGGRIQAGEVELGAVAGGEEHKLGAGEGGCHALQGGWDIGSTKRGQLPYFYGGGLEVNS